MSALVPGYFLDVLLVPRRVLPEEDLTTALPDPARVGGIVLIQFGNAGSVIVVGGVG